MSKLFSDYQIGDIVKLKHTQFLRNWVVVHQGNPNTNIYNNSCNGTWLVGTIGPDIVSGAWNGTQINTLPDSAIMNKLEEYFTTKLDSSIQAATHNVKIPYASGNNTAIANILDNGLSCHLFPLSGHEVVSNLSTQSVVAEGSILDYYSANSPVMFFETGYQSQNYWLRSPLNNNNMTSYYVNNSGLLNTATVTTTGYIYIPAMVISGLLNDDGTVTSATISGSDSDLGTIAEDITYTVTLSSNVSNIQTTVSVNGAPISIINNTVSGQQNKIYVVDLPTGYNTLEINCLDTKRIYIYYKEPADIGTIGHVIQLSDETKDQKYWPNTLSEAVSAPPIFGGNVLNALNLLSNSVLYSKTQNKYTPYNIDLSTVQVGDIVKIPFDNKLVDHIVVHKGNPAPEIYDSSFNNGIWLWMQNEVEELYWNNTSTNTLANSTIMTTMNGYVNRYEEQIANNLIQVKVPYMTSGTSYTPNILENGLSAKVFPLDTKELGDNSNSTAAAILDYFTTDAQNKRKRTDYNYWTRSCVQSLANSVYFVLAQSGSINDYAVTNQFSYVPTIILPNDFTAQYYVSSDNSVYTEQKFIEGYSDINHNSFDITSTFMDFGQYTGDGKNLKSIYTKLLNPKLFILLYNLQAHNYTYCIGIYTNPNLFGLVQTGSGVVSSIQNAKITFEKNKITLDGNIQGTNNQGAVYSWCAIG